MRFPTTGTATNWYPGRWTDIPSLILAVEILSPSTERYDRGLKRIRYQRAGTPEYWIVDLDARAIERWRPGTSVAAVATDRMTWRPEPHLPLLELDLVELFAGIARKE